MRFLPSARAPLTRSQPPACAGRALHVALGFLLLDVLALVALLAAEADAEAGTTIPVPSPRGRLRGNLEQSLDDAQTFKYLEG